MKIKRLILVALLAVAAYAGETPSNRTWDLCNGRLWLTLSQPVKSAYVLGMWEGALAMDQKQARDSYGDKATFGETAKGLDLFYQEPANVLIPVSIAFMLVTARNNGATAADIGERLTKLRRMIAERAALETTRN